MQTALDARTIQDHFPGIARYTFNLALGLAAISSDDRLLLLVDPRQHNTRYDLSQLWALPNIDWVETHTPNFSLSEQWRVPALLRSRHATLYHSPYYIMPYRLPCPAVATIHDLIPLLYPHYFSPVQRIIFALTVRLAARSAQRIIAVSQSTANDLVRRLAIPAARIAVIPEAPDPAFTPQVPDRVIAVRARYGLPESYTLYLGSNKPHKNLRCLVEAQAFRTAQLDVPLVVAGHWDPRQPHARERASALTRSGRVRWLGPVPSADLPALYAGASIFLFPSQYEGFGLPVLEAMACGTPVICSNRSSLPEIAEGAAVMLPPDDVRGWALAIDRILSDNIERATLSSKGLQRASQFTWQATALQTRELYAAL